MIFSNKNLRYKYIFYSNSILLKGINLFSNIIIQLYNKYYFYFLNFYSVIKKKKFYFSNLLFLLKKYHHVIFFFNFSFFNLIFNFTLTCYFNFFLFFFFFYSYLFFFKKIKQNCNNQILYKKIEKKEYLYYRNSKKNYLNWLISNKYYIYIYTLNYFKYFFLTISFSQNKFILYFLKIYLHLTNYLYYIDFVSKIYKFLNNFVLSNFLIADYTKIKSYPNKYKLFTLLKSPHIDKKSRDQFFLMFSKKSIKFVYLELPIELNLINNEDDYLIDYSKFKRIYYSYKRDA